MRKRPRPEPWWPVHAEFVAIVVASVVTRNPLAIAGVVTAYTALLRARR